MSPAINRLFSNMHEPAQKSTIAKFKSIFISQKTFNTDQLWKELCVNLLEKDLELVNRAIQEYNIKFLCENNRERNEVVFNLIRSYGLDTFDAEFLAASICNKELKPITVDFEVVEILRDLNLDD